MSAESSKMSPIEHDDLYDPQEKFLEMEVLRDEEDCKIASFPTFAKYTGPLTLPANTKPSKDSKSEKQLEKVIDYWKVPEKALEFHNQVNSLDDRSIDTATTIHRIAIINEPYEKVTKNYNPNVTGTEFEQTNVFIYKPEPTYHMPGCTSESCFGHRGQVPDPDSLEHGSHFYGCRDNFNAFDSILRMRDIQNDYPEALRTIISNWDGGGDTSRILSKAYRIRPFNESIQKRSRNECGSRSAFTPIDDSEIPILFPYDFIRDHRSDNPVEPERKQQLLKIENRYQDLGTYDSNLDQLPEGKLNLDQLPEGKFNDILDGLEIPRTEFIRIYSSRNGPRIVSSSDILQETRLLCKSIGTDVDESPSQYSIQSSIQEYDQKGRYHHRKCHSKDCGGYIYKDAKANRNLHFYSKISSDNDGRSICNTSNRISATEIAQPRLEDWIRSKEDEEESGRIMEIWKAIHLTKPSERTGRHEPFASSSWRQFTRPEGIDGDTDRLADVEEE